MGIPLSRILLDFSTAQTILPEPRPGSPAAVIPIRDAVPEGVMGIPLSRVLLDFGATRGVPAAPHQTSASAIPGCEPVDELARKLEAAYARGADEARLTADAEHERKLAQAMAHAAEQQSVERARWASEQAEVLVGRLTSAVEALETRIADTVGRILTPFLTAELRSASVAALAESIRTLLSGGSQPALRVSGPEDLLSALRERLGAGPVAIEWEPNGEVEVKVSADDSVIETELQSWLKRFAGARP